MARKRVGRNDPCPCGSGRKYKKCCLRKDRADEAARREAAGPDVDETGLDEWLGRLDPELTVEATATLFDDSEVLPRLRRFAELLMPGEPLAWLRFDEELFAELVGPALGGLSPDDDSILELFRASASRLAPPEAADRWLDRLARAARRTDLPLADRRALHTAAVMLATARTSGAWEPGIVPPLENVFRVQLAEQVKATVGLLSELRETARSLAEQPGPPDLAELDGGGLSHLVEKVAATPMFLRQIEKDVDALMARVRRAADEGKLPALVYPDEWLYLHVVLREEMQAVAELKAAGADEEEQEPAVVALFDAVDEALDAGLRVRIRDRLLARSKDRSLRREERRLAAGAAMAVYTDGAELVFQRAVVGFEVAVRDDAEGRLLGELFEARECLTAPDLEPYAAHLEAAGEDPGWIRRAQESLEAGRPLELHRK